MKRNITILLCCVLLVPALLTPLRAGARATVRLIGMSNNGRYLAYESSGVQDGSGFPWCSIQVLDTATNLPAAYPVFVVDRAEQTGVSLAAVVKACRAQAVPLIDRLGILERNRGQRIFRAPHTRAEHLPVVNSASFSHDNIYYTLKLEQTPAGRKCGLDNTLQLLTLSLTTQKGAKPRRVVYRETTIPAHRGNGCPLGYGIAKLYVSGSRLIVHLDMATSSFEGPDVLPAFVVMSLP